MTTKLCVVCGEEIPPKRVALLPRTTTCVQCSLESKKSIHDVRNSAIVQHTGGLHEKYLKEEDIED
jgi:RNA polymerase-binding transcription factor DksA